MADQSEFLSENEKALLDTEELDGIDEAPIAPDSDKVELDLEDAPFLEDEDEEEEEEAAASGEDEYADLDKQPQKFDIKALLHDRRFQIGGGSGLLILLLAVFFLWPERKPLPEVDVDLPDSLPVAEQNATPPPPPVVEEKPEEFIVPFEPFWVEHEQEDGSVRFLYCKFAAPAPTEKLAWEIRHKKVVLRDAIFYYLRNKDLTFLADKGNVEQLKQDLLSVVNQYLGNSQLETILIEEYLVK